MESYTINARIFLEYCNCHVEQLDVDDIRKFLQYLIHEKKSSPSTVNTYSAAIRFLFAVTLNRKLNYLQIPRQKKRKTIPEVLTREEVSSIMEHCPNIKHTLKIQHIDSNTMRVFVQCGKGGKDRYTLLSEACLYALREYWKMYRPRHREGWLFLSTYDVTHITSTGIRSALNEAVKKTSIAKNVSVHTLRHSFATHLLEDGATLLQIKELLGNTNIQSATIYLHLANITAGLKSPLDNLSAYCNSEVSCNG